MWLGSTRYKRIRTVFAIAVAVFFAAGAITEYYLSRVDMHTHEYIGNLIWKFVDGNKTHASSVSDFVITLSRDFCRPAICLLVLFMFGFTVYAPAVSFSVAAYAAFTFGSLCIQIASKNIDYLFQSAVIAASSVVIAELCVYSAYLGRELAHRCPPRAKLIIAMPEVREMFILLCISSCKLLLFITTYRLIMPRL